MSKMFVSVKEQRSKPIDDLQKLSQSCQSFLLLLKFAGINICLSKQKQNRKYKYCTLALLVVAVLIAAGYNIGSQILGILDNLGTNDLWILCFNEHLLVSAFLYVITIRENKIKKFTVDLMQMAISNDQDGATIRQIGKCSSIIAWISVLLIMTYSPLLIYFHAISSVQCEEWFRWVYLGLEIRSPVIRVIFSLAVEIAYCYNCLLVQIYAGFVTFLIYLLTICYQNKSHSLKQLHIVTVNKIANFQEQHHKLNEMVDAFNKLFSPAMLVLILVLMGQQIGTPGNVKSQYFMYTVFPTLSSAIIRGCFIISPIVTSSYALLALFKMTNKLHKLSKDIFDELVNTSISHPEIYQCSVEDLVKHCSKTTLFTAKWSSSSATINASGYFTLDYTLIGVVLSITVTYWSLIGELKDGTESAAHTALNITCVE